MSESGVIPSEARVELIDGIIYEKHPLGPFHCSIARQIVELLRNSISGANFLVQEEKPIELDEFSLPVPDVAVVRKRDDDPYFAKSHPLPLETELIVEISDSSYLNDRNIKLRAYAKAGIREVWIVNANQMQIEWFRSPESVSEEFQETGICDGNGGLERSYGNFDFSKISF